MIEQIGEDRALVYERADHLVHLRHPATAAANGTKFQADGAAEPRSWEPRQLAGLLANAGIRASMLYFAVEAALLWQDKRFKDKAIPPRNLVVFAGLSMFFPARHLVHKRTKKRSDRYPFWHDNLFLSSFWLDMAGNSFNWYDTQRYFDKLAHFHGPGAVAVMLRDAFKRSPQHAISQGNGLHFIVEAQEHIIEYFFGTHNVHDKMDTVTDLIAGLLGTIVYVQAYDAYRRAQNKHG